MISPCLVDKNDKNVAYEATNVPLEILSLSRKKLKEDEQ